MTPERLAQVQQLPLDQFLRALLDDNPRLSAKELAEAARAAGKQCPRPMAKSIRESWKAAGGGGNEPEEADDVDGRAPTVEDLWTKAHEAAVAGDSQGCERWIRAWARLKELVPAAPKDDVRFRWDLLTPTEAACMQALVCKAYGAYVSDDGVWFLALLAMVPEARTTTHPAHVPLPEVPRPVIPKV